MNRNAIDVMLVDNQDLARQGFGRILAQHSAHFRMVAEARTAGEALAAMTGIEPDVIVLDTALPDTPTMPAVEALIEKLTPTAKRVLIFSNDQEDLLLYRVLQAGARGFMLKTSTSSQLLDAIAQVAAGNVAICPPMARRLVDNFRISPPLSVIRQPAELTGLTDREMQVLTGIAEGKSNVEISRDLQVTDATVKSHVSSLLNKLGLRSRVQAAILAREMGIAAWRAEPRRRSRSA